MGNSLEKCGKLEGNSQLFKFLKSGKTATSWMDASLLYLHPYQLPAFPAATTQAARELGLRTEKRGGNVAEAG